MKVKKNPEVRRGRGKQQEEEILARNQNLACRINMFFFFFLNIYIPAFTEQINVYLLSRPRQCRVCERGPDRFFSDVSSEAVKLTDRAGCGQTPAASRQFTPHQTFIRV